jgi:hypothetical protein
MITVFVILVVLTVFVALVTTEVSMHILDETSGNGWDTFIASCETAGVIAGVILMLAGIQNFSESHVQRGILLTWIGGFQGLRFVWFIFRVTTQPPFYRRKLSSGRLLR